MYRIDGRAVFENLEVPSAILGMESVIVNKNMRSGLRLFGAAVLFIFGFNLVLHLFDINLRIFT
ncbi:MAG: hypothetical protein ACQEXX_14470 [Bacillota bacterium]